MGLRSFLSRRRASKVQKSLRSPAALAIRGVDEVMSGQVLTGGIGRTHTVCVSPTVEGESEHAQTPPLDAEEEMDVFTLEGTEGGPVGRPSAGERERETDSAEVTEADGSVA
ncbi:hypothetical protein KIPB_000011 [Kipferlia bialata]|uniref:Uncharacterized protein n=1 Tax=Kipferlia bialata TaxID=797122 RepID=A0A9K3CPS3_9EUKA|nr:hypothetical protein KIPB_000011 [Kipferlia bialata]|eukprot:g11.t1